MTAEKKARKRCGTEDCTNLAVEVRVWAKVHLHFCKRCVKLWDNVVTNALTGEWEDDHALQEQSTAA